jgi:hypothetical protein
MRSIEAAVKPLVSVAALVLATGATAAMACGVCVEDKIAAAYDHVLITRSIANKHAVVFYALDGPLAGGEAQVRALRRAAEGARGADPGSARVSLESGSLSVAFDPQRAPYAAFEKSLERNLAGSGVSLLLLRVMDRPVESKKAARPSQ